MVSAWDPDFPTLPPPLDLRCPSTTVDLAVAQPLRRLHSSLLLTAIPPERRGEAQEARARRRGGPRQVSW